MEMFRITGQVDEERRLVATVPDTIAPGKVEFLVIAYQSGEDDAGDAWMAGVAREWHDDLDDPRQDIYSMTDGVPADGPR
jgi:hypothetical protein